jgi:hypothetical protein
MVRRVLSSEENEKYVQKIIRTCTGYEGVNGNKTAQYNIHRGNM